ncbi:MAG: DnaJ domain-containing protein [Bacteroidales bacterium]|nr:DnaJ domain-containing protein [Bacteroidales bacterium]
MNYYEILGVPGNATDEAIRRAFRRHAKHCHPDIICDQQATGEFQKINEAYQVLKNAEKRRLYDLRLANGTQSRNVFYRPGRTSSYRRASFHAQYYHEFDDDQEPTLLEKLFDQFLFFSMLLIGLGAIFYGLYRAWGEPIEGMNPYLGILFGLSFTAIFIFGWDRFNRLKS